ncbi:zinc finger A20 and AN1 domain-containing stress-associated protein 5-like [Cynara cardunculus var. scolymus]|uniref:zinc finger A20 and AN1 domain-containing stress-associated protein 5-like n=1 Tax=Cynara cardunculus var. scolymus TaxID=59895 RepID=UPI000D62E027|nr:zinc finger A20 and AN1 domain-containing stress-associated protein 5-like [Cynara cardunculus var. scolymus]
MAHNTEKEETELKVPKTLTLCSPPVATPPSKISGSYEQRSDPKSCGSSEVIVEMRPNSNSSPGNPYLDLKPPSVAVDSSYDAKTKRRDVNRCSGCRRKVGLTGFRCRCGEMFCSEHRYSDRHDCSYDYKAAGREAISRENPMVRPAKILKV